MISFALINFFNFQNYDVWLFDFEFIQDSHELVQNEVEASSSESSKTSSRKILTFPSSTLHQSKGDDPIDIQHEKFPQSNFG